MTEAEIVNILKESGALLNGHFQLRSGLHSDHFFQAALLLQYPDKAETVCRHLAEKFRDCEVSAVISPAGTPTTSSVSVARFAKCSRVPSPGRNSTVAPPRIRENVNGLPVLAGVAMYSVSVIAM